MDIRRILTTGIILCLHLISNDVLSSISIFPYLYSTLNVKIYPINPSPSNSPVTNSFMNFLYSLNRYNTTLFPPYHSLTSHHLMGLVSVITSLILSPRFFDTVLGLRVMVIYTVINFCPRNVYIDS